MKKINSWFEIDEHQYLMYLLKGYEINVEEDRVMWKLNDKLHREEGPAYISKSGYRAWLLHNVIYLSEAEFNEKVKQLV